MSGGLRPSVRDQALLDALRRLFRRPRRRSDLVLVPPLARGGIIRGPLPLIGAPPDPPEHVVPLTKPPTSAAIADRIHAQRHYRDDHPATPDTFWAGMRHAERIARGDG